LLKIGTDPYKKMLSIFPEEAGTSLMSPKVADFCSVMNCALNARKIQDKVCYSGSCMFGCVNVFVI